MSDVAYAYFPVFRRRHDAGELGRPAAEEIERIALKFADRVSVRGTYSGVGFRPDADLFFWWVAETVDDLQDMLVEVRASRLGRALDLTHTFLGVTRKPEFNPQHLPAFLRGEPPKKYISVYPFVRTAEWYLMDPAERGALLKQHGEMGREFADVLPNTTSSFGLNDWEWILAFEADDLTRIVDCIRRLREAKARAYTKEDVPFVVGIRKDVHAAIADLV